MTTGTIADLIPAMERGFDAIERRDRDAIVATLEGIVDPSFEFAPALGAAVEGTSSYRGIDGFILYFAGLFDAFARMAYRDREFRVIGEHAVLFLSRFEAEGTASGAELATEMAALFECRDGVVHRITSFTAHGEAIAAAEALHA